MLINEYFMQCLNGEGPLQASIRLEPISEIRVRPDVLFDLVENKKVLHLGCTDHLAIIKNKLVKGIYLHRQLSYVTNQCLGIDINREAADFLKSEGIDNIIISDITKPGIKPICQEEWDYLLMAEVLEHIGDPVSFLKAIRDHYKDHIRGVIITVPNVFGLIHLASALNAGTESINSDHRYWFTPYTLCKVAHDAGLIIDDLTMCLYENSVAMLEGNEKRLKEHPILLDEIVLQAHW
jgi:2-polyprenyl-3-methyl-5-hydroxy-6-metoxy-1,4-benzoquinol methylase